MHTLARITAALFACVATGAFADIDGKVVGVSDGDTLTVLDDSHVERKVRLAGIDAPEKRQAFGNRAKQSLSDCAFGQRVHVVGHKIDRYGRLVGKVLASGSDCNLRQVELGLAWHYKDYQREQSADDRHTYAQAEERARNQGVGLWQEPAPQPPWDYRRERR